MPNINSITPVYYNTLDPYYVHYDNLPLRNIVTRQSLINSAVENQRTILTSAIGTAGTLSNRLNQSLNSDGSLQTVAVDDALHNIAYHTDGSYDDGISIINYVRMTSSERSKLFLVEDEATSLSINVHTPSSIVLFDNEIVELEESPTVQWYVEAPNILKAHLTFPTTAIHNHYYDQIPVHDNLESPDYQTYKINSLSTSYTDGSLRVYINGVRLSETSGVYVPAASGPTADWRLISYTPDEINGTFALSRSIVVADVIRIDYDIRL